MKRLLLRTLVLAAFAMLALPLRAQVVKDQGYVPFGGAPIHYRSENLDDPIARLQQRLDQGEVQLKHEGEHGYLKSVLELLRVPVSSQTLVFSKTSFQYPQISPEHPRALYFNDDVYVGQVHEGKALEFVSFDPMQGAIFYVLDEHKSDHPKFERAILDCIQCHVAASTQKVPGVMLRSIFTAPSGTQAGGTPSYITGHESPVKERWGGWYVTGRVGAQENMGNQAKVESLDTTPYLARHSDVVAHLVLAHQTQMHNYITQANYQTRVAVASAKYAEITQQQIQKVVEPLVRYLLFANEAPLPEPVGGTSGYAEQFAALGPRDSKGRSLRDFDLQKRIFKYPCSYLIYSEAFDAIPSPAKELVFSRMFEVLSGRDQSPEYAGLSTDDRRAILEILVATKPSVPEEWKQFVRAQ
ncbi:MAG: hypothetical protein WDO18_02045 [Acidobacteriota bacterium]